MRIENLTTEEAKKLDSENLRHIRSRFINIYNRYFEGSDVQKAVGIDRRLFLNKYLILRSEIRRRGITLFRHAPIDNEVVNRIFKRAIWKLDVQSLEDIVAVPAYVSVSGDFIRSPNSVKKIEVVLMSKEENRSESFEKRIGALIKNQTGKEPFFTYNTKGPDSSYIPIFDLILKARDETKKVKVVKEVETKVKQKKAFMIKKPEETENTIRIPVGPDCEVTATITIDKGQGIKALYCGKVKKIRTFLFDKKVKAWTMASARTWIKENKAKVEKAIAEKVMKGNISKPQKCHWCDNPAIKAYIWADGRAYIPTCSEHVEKTKRQIEVTNKDEITAVRDVPLKTEKDTIFKIMKVDKKKMQVGGIIYEPDQIDTQDDFASEEEIEKMRDKFMKSYATDTKKIRINHEGKKFFFPIIESFIPEEDTRKGGQLLKAGSFWLQVHVTNKDIWKMIEDEKLEGFSLGGRAEGT